MTDSDSPTVKVLFTGLILLRFQQDRPHCEISLHRVSSDHVPSFIVKKKKSGEPDKIFWKHYGHLPDELWLDVVKMERRVEVYKNGATLDRRNPRIPQQEKDIRWAIDFESAEFHNRPLQIRPDGVGFGMYMTKGLFYTESRTDPAKLDIIRKDGGKEDKLLHSVASVIAADIFFDHDDSAIILHWGRGEQHFLRLEKEENVSYEILVDNSPALDPQAGSSSETHSELKRYYQVLADIAPSERFDLTVEPHPIDHDVPCMTAIIGIPK